MWLRCKTGVSLLFGHVTRDTYRAMQSPSPRPRPNLAPRCHIIDPFPLASLDYVSIGRTLALQDQTSSFRMFHCFLFVLDLPLAVSFSQSLLL